MEERRHKNRRVVASGEEPRCVVQDVPDDLLRLILLRLDSPLWILRAACVCKRWRRVVSGDGRDNGRAFLRLARSLHPPAVVGHYQNNTKGGDRRFVPSSPWPTIAGSRLSLDFIPSLVTGTAPIESWEVADCHAGLVLLRERTGCLSDLVICDPLTRRYRRIHHPLAQWSRGVGAYYTANMFLIDGDNGNTSVTNFRVLYRSDDDEEYRRSQLYVFSIEDGGDVGGDWRFVRRSERDDRYRDGFGHVAGRVDGSLYLGLQAGGLAVLDEAKLEFSRVDLPSIHLNQSILYPNIHAGRSTFAVVHSAVIADPDAASPPPPAVFIVHVHGEALELFCLARGSGDGDGDGEWVLDHSIPMLSKATRGLPGYPDHKRFWWQTVEVIAGGTGFAVLSAWVSDHRRASKSLTWLFSFNVDTRELQAVTNEDAYCGKTVTSTYTLPWPCVLRASRPLKPKSVSPIKANPTFFQFPRTS